jgi:hypothetical protein
LLLYYYLNVVILLTFQVQVDGLIGQAGINVPCHVGVVYNLVLGNVLERQNVKGMTARVNYVTHIIVQVCGFLSSLYDVHYQVYVIEVQTHCVIGLLGENGVELLCLIKPFDQ